MPRTCVATAVKDVPGRLGDWPSILSSTKGQCGKYLTRDLALMSGESLERVSMSSSIRWKGKLYFDITMPMGLRSSAMCCQRLTNVIQHIFRKYGFELVPYLDDMGSEEVNEKADEAFSHMGSVLEDSG